MRRTACAALAVAISVAAFAEGYQVNTFSARQEGMGHVGVAMKLGAESQIFNPGALAMSTSNFEISGSVSAIKATATATYQGRDYTTNNKLSTPLNVATSFRIYDNLYAGVTLFTPYGSSINWGKNWPGAILNQSVDLKIFTIQPTVSYRLLPNLSVGAGLMISWGSVNLNKALAPSTNFGNLIDLVNESNSLKYQAAQLEGMLTGQPVQSPAPQDIAYTDNGVPPASVNLTGKSDIAVGVNAGIMWDINRRWTVGASFRSKMSMKVKAGDAAVEYNDEIARAILSSTLDYLNSTNFAASMPCPYVLTLGVSYKPIDRLILAFDAQLNGWGTYKQLDITFDKLPDFDQHLTKNYHNAMTYHVGAQFAMTQRLDLRAGMMIDCSPCDINHYNPETPGMTKIEPSVGLSFRPVKGLSIDLAFMYVKGLGTDRGTGSYDDILARSFNANVQAYNAGIQQYNAAVAMANQMGLPLPAYQGKQYSTLTEQATFTAKYATRALIPAIGISYSF
ncbi:MAG: aromatic hydrocarbon degradation protein [Bacteroidales bacterium]|nr:aromatic hydrocarbon degradation protein [Bacteroidales bacterium]